MSHALNLVVSPIATDLASRDVLVLIFGWALGIISSPISDAMRRRSAKLRLTRAVVTELRSLQDTLAGVIIQISKRHQALTRPLLETLMSTLRSSGHVLSGNRALRMIDALLELDEHALTATQTPAPHRDPREILSLKVQGLPFLESHLHRLDLYSLETQRLIIEVRAGLQLFNRYEDEAMHYHFMMFSGGTGREHIDVLSTNVETCYERAVEKASDLVARIAVVLQSPEMRTSGQGSWFRVWPRGGV